MERIVRFRPNIGQNMKKLSLLIVFIFAALATWAVKAYTLPVTVTQSDGTQLTVIGHGGSEFHWYTTTDGTLLVHVGTDYFVAQIDSEGELMPTRQLAHEPRLRSAAEKRLVAAQNKMFFHEKAPERMRRAAARHEPVSGNYLFPHNGEPKAVVILVDFPDVPFTLPDPKKSFEQYLNSMEQQVDFGNRENDNAASVKKYFKDMSDSAFIPQFDLYGPVTLSQNMSYYGKNKPNGKDNDNYKQVVSEACGLLDDEIDFSQYDSDGDNCIDLVYVIYAGYGENFSGNSADCLWPKSWSSGATGTYDGKSIRRCGINNELNGYPDCFSAEPKKRINGIGLFCHEFSHCLGLPDFYPANNNSARIDNQSPEYWSLMDNGEYVRNGYCPTAYTAWEREAMGWMTIEELTDSGDVELVNIDRGGKAYRIRNENHPNEYFIIQNIQLDRWNSCQMGHGMIVFHVDYDQTIFNNNKVNDIPGIPRMSIVPADGKVLSSYNVDNVTITSRDYYTELAGDPFPGTSNVTQLDETMDLPNFQVHYGETINKAFHNITETDGVVRFKFINDFASSIQIEPTDIAQLDSAIYVEKAQGCKGNSGAIAISLKNTQEATSYQFNLKLPEGVTLKTDNDDEYACTLSNRHRGHNVTITYQEEDGVYSIEVTSEQSKLIDGNDGAVLTFAVNVADSLELGTYPIYIQNACYLLSDSTAVQMPETIGLFNVEDYQIGDVNEDGDIDIADAVCIVNHAIGKPNNKFVEKAADVDNDNEIDIADAVKLVNYIINKITVLARGFTEPVSFSVPESQFLPDPQ